MKNFKIIISFLIMINPILTGSQESDLALNQLSENSFSEELIFNEVETNYELTLIELNSYFKIKGTSSLHDWEMISNSFSSNIFINKTSNGNLAIRDININVGVKTLKSGKKVMDKKCYKALLNKKYPYINYKFKSIKEIKPKGDNTFTANLIGILTIAGKSKTTEILVEIVLEDRIVNIIGEKALKMSDFDVIPPTALLGTLKTGNDITIEFNLNY